LLNTQLANDSASGLAAACHWHSTHPLKERIAMLKYSSPGLGRRLGGIAFSLTLTLTGGYAVWAAQPEVPVPGSSEKAIAVNMKWWVNGADMLQPGGTSATRDIRVVSGKEFVRKVSFGEGHVYETQCVASLSNDRKSPVWKTAEAAGQNVDGLILFECKLLQDGKVFATPALLTGDSKIARIEMINQEGGAHVRLEFNASTLPARVAASQ
jgi:hypothetical protein